MNVATATSWKTRPLPEQRQLIEYQRQFSAAEIALLRFGLIPGQMEDKWFVYLADQTLHFHRSWTGIEIYQLPLSPTADGGGEVASFWANRNAEEYTETNDAADRQMLAFLIDRLLLNRPAPFPAPPDLSPEQAAVLQHHLVGHGRSNQQ